MRQLAIDIVRPVCPTAYNHRQIRQMRPQHQYITAADGTIYRYIKRNDPCKDTVYVVHREESNVHPTQSLQSTADSALVEAGYQPKHQR